jgi:hypothetical protein
MQFESANGQPEWLLLASDFHPANARRAQKVAIGRRPLHNAQMATTGNGEAKIDFWIEFCGILIIDIQRKYSVKMGITKMLHSHWIHPEQHHLQSSCVVEPISDLREMKE